jgi:hypothetical protein
VPIGAWKYLSLLGCVVALYGCASQNSTPGDSSLVRSRNQGYALLYELMGDESKVGQIFILKSAEPSVHDLVTQVGAYCKSTKSQLDAFAKADPHLAFNQTGLPETEQKSRDLESDRETKSLLLSTGQPFEERLLFTQAQAMGYASDLAAALVEQETDPARKDFLKNLSHRCGEFRDELMGHLAAHA